MLWFVTGSEDNLYGLTKNGLYFIEKQPSLYPPEWICEPGVQTEGTARKRNQKSKSSEKAQGKTTISSACAVALLTLNLHFASDINTDGRSGDGKRKHFMGMALAFHPHVDGDFGHQKRRFSKTVSKVEIFKNAVLSFLRMYT